MKKNKKKNILYVSDIAQLTVLVDAPEPPPVRFISPFKTIEEWLFHLCDTNDPKQIISECHITLIELPWGNVLSLMGWNKITIDENTISHRRVFRPTTDMYFPLPNDKFGNLSEQLIREQVINELIEFTKSIKFKNSFLSKVQSLQINIKGQIWSK
ncbi:MAG TPA: hypothetical protein VET23_13570 [Chitinophagaceae bacterium]|nr:hypothetical protein [Chitinophagaceae bacterium]